MKGMINVLIQSCELVSYITLLLCALCAEAPCADAEVRNCNLWFIYLYADYTVWI